MRLWSTENNFSLHRHFKVKTTLPNIVIARKFVLLTIIRRYCYKIVRGFPGSRHSKWINWSWRFSLALLVLNAFILSYREDMLPCILDICTFVIIIISSIIILHAEVPWGHVLPGNKLQVRVPPMVLVAARDLLGPVYCSLGFGAEDSGRWMCEFFFF